MPVDKSIIGRKGEPVTMHVERGKIREFARAIKDPALRAKLTPDYRIGCKRILLSSTYYPALAQPNVDVVASGLSRVVMWSTRLRSSWVEMICDAGSSTSLPGRQSPIVQSTFFGACTS